MSSSQRLPPVSVYVIDTDSDPRSDLRSLVAATPGFVLAGKATSGYAAIAAISAIRPDIVLIAVPATGGLATAEILADSRRDLVIGLVTTEPVERYDALAAEHGEIAVLNQRELSPRALLNLWHGRRTR